MRCFYQENHNMKPSSARLILQLFKLSIPSSTLQLAAGQPASWNCWALIQHRRNCERLLRLKDQLSAIDQWTYKLTCQIVKCLKCKSFVNYFLSALRCCHFWTSYLRFNIHILNIQKWEIMKEQFASSESIKSIFSQWTHLGF